MALPADPPAMARAPDGGPARLRLRGSAIGQVGWPTVAVDLSVVIPCYNEEQRLPRTIEEVERYLKGRATPYELILVDDGSLDGTRQVMDAAADRHHSVRVEALPHNRGKGRALATGVE